LENQNPKLSISGNFILLKMDRWVCCSCYHDMTESEALLRCSKTERLKLLISLYVERVQLNYIVPVYCVSAMHSYV